MDDLLLISRLLLTLIFLFSGITKLLDQQGTKKALADFGLPSMLTSSFTFLLPIAELVVAAALIPVALAWWGALGALSLLLIFIAAIGYNLAQGRAPDCNCFGQVHSSPIGWQTIVRNVLFAAVAGFILWRGQVNAGASLFDWFGSMTSSQLVLLFFVAFALGFLVVEGYLLLRLFRQNGRLLLRMDALEQALAAGGNIPYNSVLNQPHNGLALGASAPTFELPNLDGETLSLDSLRSSKKPVMLIFSNPGCGPCTALLPEISRWQQEYKSKITIALVSQGTVEENQSKLETNKIEPVLLQERSEVADSYQSYGTPMAVIVNPDGTIGSSAVGGSEAITALVAKTVGAPIPQMVRNGNNGNGNGHAHLSQPVMMPGVKIGDEAPQFELPDIDGKTVRLADFKGSETLLLFWNPNCGFCSRMVDDIKAWETHRAKGAIKLVVVSTGTVEANQAQEFKSTVVLDQGFNVAPLYGAGGTPSAVLVSTDGKVASELVVGAEAVLALAGAKQGDSVAVAG